MLRKLLVFVPLALVFLVTSFSEAQSNGAFQPPRHSRLGFRIAADGSMTGSFTIEPYTQDYLSCFVSLFARTSDGDLKNVGSVRPLFANRIGLSTNRFRAFGLKKAIHGEGCKPHIVHLVAHSACRNRFSEDNKTFFLVSNVASRYLTCGASPALEIGPWTDDFVRRVQSLSPARPTPTPLPPG